MILWMIFASNVFVIGLQGTSFEGGDMIRGLSNARGSKRASVDQTLAEVKGETGRRMVVDTDLCFYGSATDQPIAERSSPVSLRSLARTESVAASGERAHRLGDAALLTLDGYGALVDRESGIVNALMPWLRDAGVTAGRGEIIRAFAQAERTMLIPGLSYREVLVRIHDVLAEFFEVAPDPRAAEDFAASIQDWPVHADASAALRYLKQHFQLVVLTNVDHAAFAHASAALGVEFDAVYTAEDVGSYKPNVRNFEFLLDRLEEAGVGRDRVLHVAGSIRFDHVPAKRVGMRTCWVHRKPGRPPLASARKGGIEARPDFQFDSLEALARAHWAEIGKD
jgi:2-haloalkanoic acid dehalogenase type II